MKKFDFYVKIKRLVHTPLQTIGELYLPNKSTRFCWTLEDIERPAGVKVREWTALPRTEGDFAYTLGIRYSPKLKRDCINIYTEADKETLRYKGVEFKYAMLHGGNDNFDTEGCPLVAYNLLKREVTLEYGAKRRVIDEQYIQGTAEKEVTLAIRALLEGGKTVGLQIQ